MKIRRNVFKKTLSSSRGFTVLELIVFAAIFTTIAITFLSILVVIGRIQSRQTSASQVNRESLFILQTVQRYVESASLVDMPIGVSSSTLSLRTAASTTDPTILFASSTPSGTIALYVREGAGPNQQLTSGKVTIPTLQFTRRSNPAGRDAVEMTVGIAFNTQNPQQRFERNYRTSVARRSAVLFGSDIVPAAAGAQAGNASQKWNSINDLLYFDGPNIGIGTRYATSVPGASIVELNGPLRLTSNNKPDCLDNSNRGFLWFKRGISDATDAVMVCTLDASVPSYQWSVIVGETGIIGRNGGGRQFTGDEPLFSRRALAATFDSDLVPATSGLKIGNGGGAVAWSSVNSTIFLDYYAVGVGGAPSVPSCPGGCSALDIRGGLRINYTGGTPPPACNDVTRGLFWIRTSSSSEVMQVCMRDEGVTAWVTL